MNSGLVIILCCSFTLVYFVGLTAANIVHTTEVTWAGGVMSCSCRKSPNYWGNYACSSGTESGDWSNGTKYFTDTQTNPAFLLTQVNFSLYGSFDCNEDVNATIELNGVHVASVLIPHNTAQPCQICPNCWASDTPLSVSGPVYSSGWPMYMYGHINEVSLIIGPSAHNYSEPRFCMNRMEVQLTFNETTLVPDGSDGSDDDHISVDAPTWFWSLIMSVGVLVIILVMVFFVLWRRTHAIYNRHRGKGYRPLTQQEYTYVDPSQLDDIKIEGAEINIEQEIGNGSFGKVHKGTWRGTLVAIKRLPLPVHEGALAINNDEEGALVHDRLTEFMNEAFIMRGLRHPNVLQVLGASHSPTPCIVMEYMPRGSLYHILHDQSVQLDWPLVKKMALDVCLGMAYLHSRNPPLIHRDLKPHNLLVDENWRVKVCDFGLSKFLVPKGDMTACGTPAYCAPEVLRNAQYTTSADVYSFGIVLWEMYTREPVYQGMPPFQIIFQVSTQGKRPPIPPSAFSSGNSSSGNTSSGNTSSSGNSSSSSVASTSNWPPGLARLIDDCWCDSPSTRPSFTDIVERLKDL